MPINPPPLKIDLNATQDTIEIVADRIAALKTKQGNVEVSFVSVDFDLVEGTSKAIENNGQGVQIEFNFAHVNNLINGAMSLLAKQELLRQLQLFDDADINRLITQTSFSSLNEIDHTLFLIKKLGVPKHSFLSFNQEPPKPLHANITNALADFVNINSLSQVSTIMQNIANHPTLSVSRRTPQSDA